MKTSWRDCWRLSGLYWYGGPCLAIYWRWRGKTHRIRTLAGWFRCWDLRSLPEPNQRGRRPAPIPPAPIPYLIKHGINIHHYCRRCEIVTEQCCFPSSYSYNGVPKATSYFRECKNCAAVETIEEGHKVIFRLRVKAERHREVVRAQL